MKLNNAKGVTLIELIVVVFIASIIISAVVINVSLVKPHEKLDTLTSHVIKLVKYAHQEAVLSNKHHALSLNKDGYIFLKFQGEDWIPVERNPLQPRKIAANFINQLVIDEKAIEALEKGKYLPHILMLSSGEVSPFEWTFNDKKNQYEITLEGTFTGEIKKKVRDYAKS